MQTPYASPDPNLAENLARQIVQILAANPTYTPEQVLDTLAGPLGDALKHSPPLKHQVLTLLKAETNRAAIQEFQRAPSDASQQQKLFATLETTLAANSELIAAIQTSLTSVATEQTRIRRLLAIGIGLLALTLLIVFGVFGAFWCQVVVCELPLETPPPNSFKTAFLPDTGTSQDWQITALGASPDATNPMLWVGAKTGEGSDTRYALLRANTKTLQNITFENVPFQFDHPIERMEVDCKGNVWLLLHSSGNPPQVRVVKADASDDSARLDIGRTGTWFYPSNIFALETSCEQDAVQMWFGQDRVRTLCYTGNYPIFQGGASNVSFVPCALRATVPRGIESFSQYQKLLDADYYYRESDASTSIRALLYDVERKELLFASQQQEIGIVPPQGKRRVIGTAAIILSFAKRGTEIWAGGSDQLVRFQPAKEGAPKTILVKGHPIKLIVSGEHWRWFASNCDANPDCRVLSVIRDQTPAAVPLNVKEVNAIVIDSLGTLWIGTERGLRFFQNP